MGKACRAGQQLGFLKEESNGLIKSTGQMICSLVSGPASLGMGKQGNRKAKPAFLTDSRVSRRPERRRA